MLEVSWSRERECDVKVLATNNAYALELWPRPSIDGIGFRRARACGILGIPWIARGSFMSVGSSFAGTTGS